MPPTKSEARKWDRALAAAGRAALTTGATSVSNTLASTPLDEWPEEKRAALEVSRARYEALKQQSLFWTLGMAGVCCLATAVFYSKDVSTSYAVGALGGIAYLRSLSRSVDAMAGQGSAGDAANPRLLIPLILVLGANRFNELKGDELNVHIQVTNANHNGVIIIYSVYPSPCV